MRTLRFIVDGQIVQQDQTCDFSNLIPGTEGYLRAEFSFSRDWDGAVKVATFWSALGKEYPPRVLKDGRSCIIPAEALKKRVFKVQVIAKKGDLRLTTNKVAVSQDGGKT